MIVSTCNRVELLAAVEGDDVSVPRFSLANLESMRPSSRLTSTNTATGKPSAISSAWPRASIPWSSASRRFSAR
jgi:glutamyl-tRNA reductase